MTRILATAVLAITVFSGSAILGQERDDEPPRSIAEMALKTFPELQREQLRLRQVVSEMKPKGREDAWQHILKSKLIGDIARMQYLERALGANAPAGDRQPIKLPADPLRITIPQRNTKAIQGFQGIVKISIRDVTHQQVLLEVISEELTVPIIDTVSVEQGDVLPFNVGGVIYYLTVVELRNHLIGDDFAVFDISTQRVDEVARIKQLLKTIETSKVGFIRNGKETTGAEAARHLRTKWRKVSPPITTVEGFINRVASRSTTTGESYLVRLDDDSQIESHLWLRRQLAEEVGAEE